MLIGRYKHAKLCRAGVSKHIKLLPLSMLPIQIVDVYFSRCFYCLTRWFLCSAVSRITRVTQITSVASVPDIAVTHASQEFQVVPRSQRSPHISGPIAPAFHGRWESHSSEKLQKSPRKSAGKSAKYEGTSY